MCVLHQITPAPDSSTDRKIARGGVGTRPSPRHSVGYSRGHARSLYLSNDVADELKIDHKTVSPISKKLDTWVPYELTERNLVDPVLICDSLLKRNETVSFLKRLINGDEKWITYDKNVQNRSWSKGKQAPPTKNINTDCSSSSILNKDKFGDRSQHD
ncbi:Histone-lysine N-methyltransferase SETMAR [Eumeta japonica]|uniref:Histone-lysine N-methyltransferase SETMAR n=1 Tax=Eumeta variegata TaxID=151549 RepID=A0A4C1ZN04_EUMVA|nr:Histone-lysine N-methyltransferase SETMAR [Eumeta japonica]